MPDAGPNAEPYALLKGGGFSRCDTTVKRQLLENRSDRKPGWNLDCFYLVSLIENEAGENLLRF